MRIEVADDCGELLDKLNGHPTAFKFGWVGLIAFSVYKDHTLPRNTLRVERYGQVTFYFLKDGHAWRMGPEAGDPEPVLVAGDSGGSA